MPFVDIHCHLLPGLDDGAFHEADMLRMAALAVSANTTGMICTPHRIPGCRYTYGQLTSVFIQTCSTVKQNGYPLRLYLGQEIFLSDSMDVIIRDLETGALFTLGRSMYPLVEFDPYENVDSVYSKITRLAAHGFVPIIAHPERYAFLNESRETAWKLRGLGALLQINKGSLRGYFGHKAAETAHYLLRERLADFVATDAHSPHERTPGLQNAHEWISETYSLDYADFLMVENPERILRNENIYPFIPDLKL